MSEEEQKEKFELIRNFKNLSSEDQEFLDYYWNRLRNERLDLSKEDNPITHFQFLNFDLLMLKM